MGHRSREAVLKRCSDCDKEKDFDPENGGGEWYTRPGSVWKSVGEGVESRVKVIWPSPYCRDCTKARNRAHGQEARQQAKLRTPVEKLMAALAESVTEHGECPGTCEVCGFDDLVLIVAWPSPTYLCRTCRGILGEIGPGFDGRDRARVEEILGILTEHNAKERELEAGVRTGETRPDHRGNKMVGAQDHETCLVLGEKARAVFGWIMAT